MALLIDLSRLAVFHHAGALRLDFHIAPGVFDVLLSCDIAFVDGFFPCCVHARAALTDRENSAAIKGAKVSAVKSAFMLFSVARPSPAAM